MLEGAGDVCGGAGWRWKNTLKVMGMLVVMVMMEMEEYLEGDGDVCGDDDDGVGSVP